LFNLKHYNGIGSHFDAFTGWLIVWYSVFFERWNLLSWSGYRLHHSYVHRRTTS